jgi:hypothetical protein
MLACLWRIVQRAEGMGCLRAGVVWGLVKFVVMNVLAGVQWGQYYICLNRQPGNHFTVKNVLLHVRCIRLSAL